MRLSRLLSKKPEMKGSRWDAYRRFIQMFGDVVMGVKHEKFEHALQPKKTEKGAKVDTDLTASDLKELVDDYKKIVNRRKRHKFSTGCKRTA